MNERTFAVNDQEGAWIGEVSRRLRLVQADAGSATPQQRREFLAEELARSLKTVAGGRRKALLNALLERFPVAGQVGNGSSESAVKAAASPDAAVKPAETFDDLLGRFLKAATELRPDQKAAVLTKLAEAGLREESGPAPAARMPADVGQALGLPAGQQPVLDNVVRLCALFMEMFQRLDQTALASMRELAPRSQLLKRPQDFRAAVLQYLTQEQGDSIEPQMRMVSGLLGALLAAIMGGGKDFGRHYVERLSPSAIEDVVMAEGGSSIFGKSKKERCWDKYVLLAREFETPDLVDRRLRDCLAAFVEKKVLGAR